ncbi:MAG: hypothetical protein CSA25_04865 [Desulfobacter postgatei]|uniref:Uncharacterized protein n=1 Tax=Desulfobacter postgatei TaxID=2293 RepID=A0A2G6MRD9_9BACT|nr:MAG: hypothetical protein CSA25_04865 [Desulfobacter postgatei]
MRKEKKISFAQAPARVRFAVDGVVDIFLPISHFLMEPGNRIFLCRFPACGLQSPYFNALLSVAVSR